MPAGRKPKPVEQKERLGNPGKRPLPKVKTTVKPVQVEVVNGHGPTTGLELVEALMAAGAAEWISETDGLATLRLVKDAWDERAVLKAIIAEEGHTQKVGERIERHPAVAMLRELEKQLSVWLGLLGLDPANRGRLGLAKVQAEKAGLEALREKRALKDGRHDG